MEGFRAASPEIAALLEGVERRHLVRAEIREASYDRPLCERVASGVALDGLRYEGSAAEAGGERVLLFSGRRNDSRLRPGSRLRLSRGDARKPVARLELVGDRFEGGRYLFRLSGPVERTAELEAPGTWVFDEDEPDLLEAETEMLRLADKRGLGAWLCGAEPVLLDPAGDSPLGEGLSGSMGEAFRRALSAAAWFPVQGPPGSGKTHLLARLALHYARVEGLRVLITAVSHQAIHNALSETACLARKLPFDGREGVLSEGLFKLASSRGHNAGLPEGVRPVRGLPAARGPSIVGATVYSAFQAAARTAPSGPPFDAVLFDEAGQAHMVLALGARLLAPQAVFIGDDAQMPPVTESLPGGAEEEGERLSALGRLRRIYGEPFLLAQTRRLNEELCSVVSDCFYSGRLGPTPEAARRRLCLARPAGPAFSPILDPERSLVFLDVPHQGCRSVCEPEALWAAAIVREAARCGVPPEDIGVISPFRAQCNRIRFLLDDPRTLCATVERFQGMEREMVVISLASSQPAYLSRLAAFLFDPNRLNVALSRARTKAVLIGSRGALEGLAESADADCPGAGGLQVFLRLLGRARGVDGGRVPEASPGPSEPPPEAGVAFEPGQTVFHPRYGAGAVLRKSLQIVDGAREWVNEVRFEDGALRTILPRLSGMRRAD